MSNRNKEIAASACELTGAASVCAALWSIAPALGLLALGVCFIVVGRAIDGGTK
jgi:hypothetical protein